MSTIKYVIFSIIIPSIIILDPFFEEMFSIRYSIFGNDQAFMIDVIDGMQQSFISK